MNIKFCTSYICLLLVSFSLFISCEKSSDDTLSKVTFSGPVELPILRKSSSNLFITHQTTFQGQETETYSMEYDCNKKHARWIAFRFDGRTGQKNTSRNEDFQADPSIPTQYQRERSDFGAKGYDRGHICASEDRVYSVEANLQTFYYSNMSPQKNAFNAGIWVKLEEKIQNWGRSNVFRDTLYVVKGGTIDKEDQILTYINGDKTKPVPKYYFMALLCKKGEAFKSIGFWFEHKSYSLPYKLSEQAVTIDKLEELTGLDFFHHLPDKLENAVESQINTTGWPNL